MEKDLLPLLLPTEILAYFEVEEVLELGDVFTKKMVIELHLTERNKLPSGYAQTDYESKGYYKTKRIQDFPIRGKAVYLNIKRRRWRLKSDKSKTIQSDFSFIAEGSKLTRELSDFLKGTGRDPRRYDK